MRLVSCVGLLMVIPAIALLTRSNEPQLNKLRTIETHQQDKTSSTAHEETVPTDSVLLTKVNHVPAQNHPDFTAKSAVKSNSVPTNSK
jgi:hypothetical protein